MKQEHKLYAGVAILVVLGIGVYAARSGARKEVEQHQVTATEDLPTVKLSKEETEKITKFVIKNTDKGEVTLEKKGDKWELVKPLRAPANQANVKSLIDNIQKIELNALIAKGTESYKKYELDDEKAVHAQAFKGDEKAFDLFFGKSGSRGQMARVAGTDAVYAAKGYSSYQWAREIKNWRDTEILKFEDENAISVEVENPNGKFSFTKQDDEWTGSFYPRNDKGKLGAKLKDWELFDGAKVKNMLRAYKNLKATNFAEKGDDTGVDDPLTHGGVVRIKLKDDAGDFTVKVGNKQEGSNRYVIEEGDDDTVYVISGWAADWATAEQEKFQKPKPKEDDEDDKDKKDDKDDKDKKDDKKKATPIKPKIVKKPPPKPPSK